MSLESELQRRLASTAAAFEPDPVVLAAAERRVRRLRALQRTTRLLAVAGTAALVAVVVLVVISTPEPAGPIIDAPPMEPENDAEVSETVPEPSPDGAEDSTPEAGDEVAPADLAGTWAELAPGPLEPRRGAAAAWTGDRVFVWGGTLDAAGSTLATDGALYDPDARSWAPIADAPVGLADATAVWTGEEVLVFGGVPSATAPPAGTTLLAYDPATDDWRVEDAAPIEPRSYASVTWTGDEVIVWGGATFLEPDDSGTTGVRTFADGAAFDPVQRSWRPLASAPIEPRGAHGAVWNGRRLVVFGGGAANSFEGEFGWSEHPGDGAAYDPETDSWATIQAPEPGPLVAADWTGSSIVYWTGHVDPDEPGNWLPAGRTWDPSTGEVEAMRPPPFDGRRDEAASVWAPELGRLLTWGGAIGEGGNHLWHTGASYNPADDVWTPMADSPLGARTGHVAVWTGTELIVWGGATDGFEQFADGGEWTLEYELRGDGASWHGG